VLRHEQSVRGEKFMAPLHVKPIPSQAKQGMDQAIKRAGNDPRSPGIYRPRIIS
jgi:hypothetical protein